MDYTLLILIGSSVGLTILALLARNYLDKKKINKDYIDDSLDITKILVEITNTHLSKYFDNEEKIKLYSLLILEGIEYIKVINEDITIDEKIKLGLDIINDSAQNLDITLNDEELNSIKSVLYLVYGVYSSVFED